MNAMLWVLAFTLFAFLLIKISSIFASRRHLQMQTDIVNHAQGVCEEYERAFYKQIDQLRELLPGSYVVSVESRLRVRLIGVLYVIQGYLDLAHTSGKEFFPLSHSEQITMATGIAAEPLDIHRSTDELKFRSLTADLVREMTSAITSEKTEASMSKLNGAWIDALKSAGYFASQDEAVDRMVLGWAKQSATAGLKEWSQLAYANGVVHSQ